MNLLALLDSDRTMKLQLSAKRIKKLNSFQDVEDTSFFRFG